MVDLPQRHLEYVMNMANLDEIEREAISSDFHSVKENDRVLYDKHHKHRKTKGTAIF